MICENKAKWFCEEKEGLNEQPYNGSVLEERLRLTNQIFTLKEENTELKDKLNNLSKVAEVRLANWQKYEKENAELKEKLAGAERTRDNLIQLGFPTFQSCKEYADKMNYAKTIIKDLLDNSDEYARQRAEDFLKESE